MLVFSDEELDKWIAFSTELFGCENIVVLTLCSDVLNFLDKLKVTCE